MAKPVFVRKPGLVNRVAFALFGAFAEIARFEPLADDAGQRIAHLEEEVGTFAAYGEQIHPVGGFRPIGSRVGRKAGKSGLHPDKLPVEVQIVHHVFARLKRIVLRLTLGTGGKSENSHQQCHSPDYQATAKANGACSDYFYLSSSCLHLAFVF